MKVVCHTNLDLKGEEWPNDLPVIPRVGDRIQSARKHKNNFQLVLEVCSVTWKVQEGNTPWCREWIPHIELHLSSLHKGLYPPKGIKGEQGSIVAFYHWYAPLVGTTASAFI